MIAVNDSYFSITYACQPVTDTTLDRYVWVTENAYEELVHPDLPGNATDRPDARGDYSLDELLMDVPFDPWRAP